VLWEKVAEVGKKWERCSVRGDARGNGKPGGCNEVYGDQKGLVEIVSRL